MISGSLLPVTLYTTTLHTWLTLESDREMTKIAAGMIIGGLETAFLAIMDMVWKIEIPTPTNNIIAAHTSSYSRHKAENKPFHHKIHEKVWRSFEAMKQPWREEFETWSGVYFCILMSVAETPVTKGEGFLSSSIQGSGIRSQDADLHIGATCL